MMASPILLRRHGGLKFVTKVMSCDHVWDAQLKTQTSNRTITSRSGLLLNTVRFADVHAQNATRDVRCIAGVLHKQSIEIGVTSQPMMDMNHDRWTPLMPDEPVKKSHRIDPARYRQHE